MNRYSTGGHIQNSLVDPAHTNHNPFVNSLLAMRHRCCHECSPPPAPFLLSPSLLWSVSPHLRSTSSCILLLLQIAPVGNPSLLDQRMLQEITNPNPPVIRFQLAHLCMGKAMCRTALHGRISLRIPSASLLFSSSVRRRGSLATKLSITT